MRRAMRATGAGAPPKAGGLRASEPEGLAQGLELVVAARGFAVERSESRDGLGGSTGSALVGLDVLEALTEVVDRLHLSRHHVAVEDGE